MSYFSDQYHRISYPMGGPGPGLYNAQLGAIHALASHFTIDDRPAIVTMPTGSGKTAVLMMLPFVLRSVRTLVITPSTLVRGQIVDDFRSLRTLREIGVVKNDIPLPRVFELKERISSLADWEALREYGVIVSTPNCTSPGHEGIPEPPGDLFDLLLIDEAHHSPAPTWAALLDSLKTTRRALFSATPFRRDRAEIPGRFVYSYPISRAYDDHIFGRIAFIPVDPQGGENSDVAIAARTAQVLDEDRRAGLNHFVMVRTDRKNRANELAELYRGQTPLRLKVVHSGLSNRTVQKRLSEMERGELDGIICVNMMGEGFNFPRLKIAAVHSPHKSLEVTLQFIGQFARTNAPDIGEAKFVAVLSEIEIERNRLFDEGAVWQKIIPELSYGRIANEIHVREVIEEFQNPVGIDAFFADLSLYSLRPRSHVKIYDVQDNVDLRNLQIPQLGNQEVCYQNPTATGEALVLITRAVGIPKWFAGDTLTDVVYELFVLYHDADTHLLFINSSRSVDGTYKQLAESVSPHARPLATGQVGRVVKEISSQRIFNIGMRNIQAANTRESYKIIAASDAQVDPADARRYRQGHVFLTGEERGERTTIGYSSGGKVWSTLNAQIPELIDWCKELGRKIRSAGPVVTHNGLDYLDAGRVVAEIPEHLIYVQWNKDAFDFATPVQIMYQMDDGTPFQGHILDLDLNVDRTHTDREHARVVISGEGLTFAVHFSLEDFYTAVDQAENRVTVTRGNCSVNLIEYLNESYLDFYTADGSLFSGNELFEPKEGASPIASNQLTIWDWDGVDIQNEVTPVAGRQSIHEKVRDELQKGDAALIIYDHGSGEIADYMTVEERADETTKFILYHCKGSAGPAPGARVEDVYEVSGQAQKSVIWASLTLLEKRLHYHKRPSQFVRGSENLFREMLDRAKDRRQLFEIKIVQPGISKARLSRPISECLGATNGHLIGIGIPPLEIFVSA